MISFFNVSKVYPNGVKALQGVSLQIEKGEFVFIVGPSGAGKSTLIKLIFREELPTKGQIYIDRTQYPQNEKAGCTLFAPSDRYGFSRFPPAAGPYYL